jgi:uncharacterized protein YbjT (DUF2867 family)
MPARNLKRVAVTGATGYIGGRLVPRLLEAGYAVRCLVRSARKLTDRPWAADPRVEIVQVDFSSPDGLAEAMSGCAAGFYLVRATASSDGEDYARDREIARHFAAAAERARLARIVYLRPLGEVEDGLVGPPDSRQEVERILASYSTPVTVLRAAMIIGSGSASFEMLRYLVERLPIMLTPPWVSTECQPIAVRNVLEYLIRCLSVPETAGLTLDIGGPEALTYRDLMRIMAEERGLRRRIVIPMPLTTPRLSAVWIHLVTPIGYRVAAPLVEDLRRRLVCRTDEARRLMPQGLLTAREAIRLALVRIQERNVLTSWSLAGPIPGDPDWSGGTVMTDERWLDLGVPPSAVYRTLCRLGGSNGWYASDWLWRLRGGIDRLVGGPGLRRGRRDPEDLGFGEAVDFWRVQGLERNRILTLRAEMKVPGVAELHFEIEPRDSRGDPLPPEATDRAPRSRLTQIARFRPLGLAGLGYWYAMVPFHRVVFTRMLKGIRAAAEADSACGPRE